ncbi:hypothetical protein LPUS_09401 [Lasallia pustulata]|uniref:Ribonucleases P/MRP subunit Pop8-like domain-containing protein n=1 Tax=Lasallia pustulata TaxID=136370 RepID=A0A1W5D7G4_9LECA|nr:hypothetical protein LPUS_09401 [Lasallia pustulata]
MSPHTLTSPPSASPSPPKRPKPSTTTTNPATLTFTIRAPPYTYLHLSLFSPSTPTHTATTPLDALTARTHLASALSQFLGLTGTAISIDILHLSGPDVWIRVPREDGAAVVAALSAWVGDKEGSGVGWRVRGRAEWLGVLPDGGGPEDLFDG